MTTPETRPADELQAALLAKGYQPVPPAIKAAWALEIDRRVASDASCDICGHHSLICEAWSRDNSYRCVAICPACLESFEF